MLNYKIILNYKNMLNYEIMLKYTISRMCMNNIKKIIKYTNTL